MTDTTMAQHGSRSTALGAAATLGVVLIWASWLVSTRYSLDARSNTLTTLDLSLIRYGLPALLLAPVWLRTGLWPGNVPKLPLVLMVLGAGALFFQIVAFGMRVTTASAAGVLLPGAMPFFTALIGIVVLGERPDIFRKIGLAAIFAGSMVLLAGETFGNLLPWQSYVILPLGATCWAIYTHAFRYSGLTAVEGAALISVWSTIINLALLPFFGTGLFEAPAYEIGLQLLTQGILSGLLSVILYGAGVRMLGASQAAAYTAITPVAAAFAGAWILGEAVGLPVIVAAFVTGAGVLLSTGFLSRKRTQA